MIAVLSGFSFSAFAQTAPIFIQKYSQPTTTSNVPTIVQSGTGQTSSRTSSSPRTYEVVDSPSPWAGSNFGKITSEIDYYDSETGQRYNQYNYMALLAKRGDKTTLNQVGNYLQSNGVFDNQKYQSAVNSAAQGNAIPSLVDQAIAKNSATPADTGAQIAQTPSPTRQAASKPKTVIKQQETYTPKRLHQGYDEDMEADTAVQSKKNQPIFLR